MCILSEIERFNLWNERDLLIHKINSLANLGFT